jgi:hypothetical protein
MPPPVSFEFHCIDWWKCYYEIPADLQNFFNFRSDATLSNIDFNRYLSSSLNAALDQSCLCNRDKHQRRVGRHLNQALWDVGKNAAEGEFDLISSSIISYCLYLKKWDLFVIRYAFRFLNSVVPSQRVSDAHIEPVWQTLGRRTLVQTCRARGPL